MSRTRNGAFALALGNDAAHARIDAGAALARIQRMGNDQTCVVGHAIRQGEAGPEMRMKRRLHVVAFEIEPRMRRQRPSRQAVVGP